MSAPILYKTIDEWLDDPAPYGTRMTCENCGNEIAIKHCSVFHVGKCENCGLVVDEACNYHTEDRGMCQLLPARDEEKAA